MSQTAEKKGGAHHNKTPEGISKIMRDPYERAISTLQLMSELVERYAYQHAPEEAADCQRESHKAIEDLRAEKRRVGKEEAQPARAA